MLKQMKIVISERFIISLVQLVKVLTFLIIVTKLLM